MLIFFFFNDTATTEIYTLSLHDALPICQIGVERALVGRLGEQLRHVAVDVGLRGPVTHGRAAERADVLVVVVAVGVLVGDRKSTRLNSSHANISYAVFCLKKKKKHHLVI